MENGSSPESRIAGARSCVGRTALSATACAMAAMWSGVVPQHPPTRLTNPASANSAIIRGRLVGCLVVLAEGVRQPRVRVARDERVGDPGHLGDVGTQLLGAEGAVEPDRQRRDVPDRRPERLGHLPGERAAAGVGDRARDDDRPAPAALLEDRLHGEDRRLGVEGVEDRLDEEQVRAAVEQAVGRIGVRRHQLVEGHVAGAGVVDVGRDGGRPGGRTQGAGDVPLLVRRQRRHLVGHAARQPSGLEVDLVGQLLHAVVGQGDRGGVEGVGLDDVGAGVEVLAVDRGDDLGLRDREQVVVALEVAGPVGEALAAVAGLRGPVALDRRAHRSVDDQDPLAQGGAELLGGIGTGVGHVAPHVGWNNQPRNVRPGGGRQLSHGDTARKVGRNPGARRHRPGQVVGWRRDRDRGRPRPGGPGRHRRVRGLERRRGRRLVGDRPPHQGVGRPRHRGDRPRGVLRLPGQPAARGYRRPRPPPRSPGRARRSRSPARPTWTATSS